VVLPLSLFHLHNCVCLSRGVQVVGAAWWAAMRIMVGVGDLVQRIGDGHTGRVLGGRMVRRLGDVMCGLHHSRGDEERRVSWLSLKTKVDGLLVVWPQNHWYRL
jgi:hypothetical protein